MKYRNAIKEARTIKLNEKLLSLSDWATRRAEGEHDDLTTITILKRKVDEIEESVNKAGWNAADEIHQIKIEYK